MIDIQTQTTKTPYQVPHLLEIKVYTQHIQVQSVPITQSINPFENFKIDDFFLDLDKF